MTFSPNFEGLTIRVTGMDSDQAILWCDMVAFRLGEGEPRRFKGVQSIQVKNRGASGHLG